MTTTRTAIASMVLAVGLAIATQVYFVCGADISCPTKMKADIFQLMGNIYTVK